MPMPASEIETLIKAAFPDADVVIEDLRGDGDHYACRVVSTAFAGKSRVQQHQICLLYTSPSPRDATLSRMPSSA